MATAIPQSFDPTSNLSARQTPGLTLVRQRPLRPFALFSPDTAIKLGRALQRQGLVPQAESLTRESLDADADGAQSAIALRLFHVECLVRMGRVDDAQRGLGLIARMAGRWGDKAGLVSMLVQQAELQLTLGSFSSAQALATHALANMTTSEEQHARLAIVNAWVNLRAGLADAAIEDARIASRLVTVNDPIQTEAAAIQAWGELRRGNTKEANALFPRAVGYARRLPDDYHRARMLALCSAFAELCGRGLQADQYLEESRSAWSGSPERTTIDNGPWWWALPVRVSRLAAGKSAVA